jgi:tetratricopeptide (TPR) repeat protein
LSSQTAVSSSATPLNVEFSTKAVMKDPGKETTPTPLNPKQSPPVQAAQGGLEREAAPKEPPNVSSQPPQPAQGSQASETDEQDPKAISESLRRIRTSGPLIIEAIKQKQDRINEIIAQSVEGLNESKAEVKREETGPPKPPAPPPPPPLRQSKQPNRPANEKPKARPASRTRPKQIGQSAGQSGVQSTAQSIAQTAASTVAAAVSATQSVARKTTGALAGSTAPRSNMNAMQNMGQLPVNGPSTVLAQASGLKPQPSFSAKFGLGLIALAVLLAAGTYFMFRDRLLAKNLIPDGERNLVSSDDQSTQFAKLAEQDRDQGNYEAAIENFQRALELAPNNANTRFLLAQTYLSANQIDEALTEYQNLLRIAPEHLEARLQIAEIYRARGNWDAAYREYRRIIELDQGSGQAAVALEAIEKYEAEQRVLELASSRGRATPRQAPVLPAANVARTQVALLSQRTAAPGINPPAALNSARPEEKPDPRALADGHKRLGVRYLNVKAYRAAINEFLQAISLTPDDKDIYYFIGSSYHGLGQLADAHEYYKRVDGGLYLGPAQSGTKQTEKAAREASKRRETQRFESIKNQVRTDSESAKPSKPVANSLKE